MSKSSSLPSSSDTYFASNSCSVTPYKFAFKSLLKNVHNHLNIEKLTYISLPNDHQEEESIADLRLKLHLHKARGFLLARDLKEARRELNLAVNITNGKYYSLALYLKSQLELACGNFEEASKVLMDMGKSSMVLNNLGCIDYRLGNFGSSDEYFLRALRSSSRELKGKPRKLVAISKFESHLITYNCGLNSLACGKPSNAARCFYKAGLIFGKSYFLWLRMAECCLMALENGRYDIRVDIVGRGKWRYLALECESLPNGGNKYVKVDNDKLVLSMSFARKCLVNVLFLLDHPEGISSSFKPGSRPSSSVDDSNRESEALSGSNGELIEQNGLNHENDSLRSSLPEYKYTCLKEKHLIKQAALAHLAYLELELEDYRKALCTAMSLLELPNCSTTYVFLGTMYKSEALCMLNRQDEAAKCLMSHVSNNNVDHPYNHEDHEKFFVKNVVHNPDESRPSLLTRPEHARGIFQANYAANLALQGDFELAHRYVEKALFEMPNSSKAVLTAVYLDLKRGFTKEAVGRLRQHKCVTFKFGLL